MSKKNFFNLDKHNIREKMDKIKMQDDTLNAISDFEKKPTIENMQIVRQVLTTDPVISIGDREHLMNWFETGYFDFFWTAVPDDLASLKKEAILFKNLTENSFYLMAVRLKKIRDGHLYTEDGYSDFKAFVENEIKINKSTAYKYINVIEVFGVEALQLEYSKISLGVGLLRDRHIPEGKKEEIKEYILKEAKDSSYKEMQGKVEKIRSRYALKIKEDKKADITESNYFKDIFTEISKFKGNNYSSSEKKYISRLIDHLKKML